jgi:Porin PorA
VTQQKTGAELRRGSEVHLQWAMCGRAELARVHRGRAPAGPASMAGLCGAHGLGAAMRKTAVASGIIGVVLVAAAFLLAFWITPAYIARLQSDSSTVRNYDGQIRTLVNPVALRQGNLAAAIKVGLPETLRRQVKVLQTSGNTALVQDATTVTASGRQVGGLTSKYAIDRTSFQATSSHPSTWSVTDAKGQTFNWPIGTKQQNYTGWVPYTLTTIPLKYTGQAQRNGISTYVYQATVPATPVKNSQVLAVLPKSVPLSLLQGAAKAGLIPGSMLASLGKAFPGLSSVPLGYVYQATSTYWVAPATGIVVDANTDEKEVAGVALPNGKIVPVLPVLADSYKFSSSSVQGAVTDANNGSSTINTFGTILPIVAGVLGFLLVVLAVFLWMRGRRHGVGGRGHQVSGPDLGPVDARP